MITRTQDLRSVRPIAENINDVSRLDTYIREAETLRLIDAIGAGLYRWLDETSFEGEGPFIYARGDGEEIEVTREQVLAVLDGGYWTACGVTRKAEGLRTAVAYLAYSRFLLNNPINPTAFGVVYKDGEFSTRADDAIAARAAAEAAKIGEAYLTKCIAYLYDLKLLPPCKTYTPSPVRDTVVRRIKL